MYCINCGTKNEDDSKFCINCGEKMEELVPNTIDAAQEKHVPVYNIEGNKVTVTVGSVEHPMTPEHLIEWVAVETDKGYQVQYLSATMAPVCEFALAANEKLVAVYAYCNLHGLWKAN